MSSKQSGPSYKWVCRIHDVYKDKHSLPSQTTSDHPLKSAIIERKLSHTPSAKVTNNVSDSTTIVEPLGVSLDGSDPLSSFAKLTYDPLSKIAADECVDELDEDSNEPGEVEGMEPWSVRRREILRRFTTSEKLTMVTFLLGGEKVTVKTPTSQIKNRLEQLDDFEEDSEYREADLTQKEYMARIELMHEDLLTAWQQDQKVTALKIIIQCLKLLVDTSVIQFYPSKFVLISDILDTFGELVYERLHSKSKCIVPGRDFGKPLPPKFTPDMVPESAKETCRNWFYKIASIRELVPRLYVEAALLKSYSFIKQNEQGPALLRLCRMVRGIGDPLVAAYTRCYLCRVASSLNCASQNFLKENICDFIASYNQLFNKIVRLDLAHQRVPVPEYLMLFPPAVDWMFQGYVFNASDKILDEVLAQCKVKINNSLCFVYSGLLINAMLATFRSSYIAKHALQFFELISACSDEGFPQYLLLKQFGVCLNQCEPENSAEILSDVWLKVAQIKDSQNYLCVAEVWAEFISKHFASEEINSFLGDVVDHLMGKKECKENYDYLQSILKIILTHASDFYSLFSMNNLIPYLDLFKSDSTKVSLCKMILVEFSHRKNLILNDLVVINSFMFICRVLHDSVNALSIEDEKRQISNLLSCFIQRVDMGKKFEEQLSFYVNARAAFTNLDLVQTSLVQCVIRLACETHLIMKGNHSSRTASFVKACIAYCFITIPSISLEAFGVLTQLKLYLLTGQVALLNQCLGQADACLKAALSLVPKFPTSFIIDNVSKSSEPFLISYFCDFLSTLLVVPDNAEQEVLFLTRELIKTLRKYPWENELSRSYLYLYALDMLSTCVQVSYPYHVKNVDSNDVYYGSHSKFIKEVNWICSVILEEILAVLKAFAQPDKLRLQHELAAALLHRMVVRADLRDESVLTLCVNLIGLIKKTRSAASPNTYAISRIQDYLKWKTRKLPEISSENVYHLLSVKLKEAIKS
ncbi:unnamed protein product [Bemisia tabaci]|uniref:Uncharacterized protein n=1 Tax=Bemisia tabaci TaxID=7038 RepID=A0A9N9ZWR5_BEMTA|nr:unnamed protein product [Bemisia tabaci]